MQLQTPIFHAWREAEQLANAAERELYNLVIQSGMCGDSQRLKEQAATARLLRKQAHELFDEAMREMKVIADSLHHRRVLRMDTAHSNQSPIEPLDVSAAAYVPGRPYPNNGMEIHGWQDPPANDAAASQGSGLPAE